jgi:hypothetical protein
VLYERQAHARWVRTPKCEWDAKERRALLKKRQIEPKHMIFKDVGVACADERAQIGNELPFVGRPRRFQYG